MSSYKYVHPRVNDYFEKSIAFMVFRHLSGNEPQKYYDSFRGALNLSFDLDYVSVEGYLFLNNFVCWLENKGVITDETEALAYKYFFDDFVLKLNDIANRSDDDV